MVKSMVFSSSHAQMWKLDYKEDWAPKNWCFQIVVLEKTLESPLTARRSNESILNKSTLNVHWKDWCWSWSLNTLATWRKEPTHWKRPWCWERLKAGGKENSRGWKVGWHHWLNGHECEQTLGDGGGQGRLAYSSPGVTKSWVWLSDCTTTNIRTKSILEHVLWWKYMHILIKYIPGVDFLG